VFKYCGGSVSERHEETVKARDGEGFDLIKSVEIEVFRGRRRYELIAGAKGKLY
jgi:hypothetical protein